MKRVVKKVLEKSFFYKKISSPFSNEWKIVKKIVIHLGVRMSRG